MTSLTQTGKCKFMLITDDIAITKMAKSLPDVEDATASRYGGWGSGGSDSPKKGVFIIRSPSTALRFSQYAQNRTKMAIESFKTTKTISCSLYPSSAILGPFLG